MSPDLIINSQNINVFEGNLILLMIIYSTPFGDVIFIISVMKV